jgi:hypothetical protein
MKNNALALFFTGLFMVLILMPSVIIAIDDSFDTSIFYSISDDEEKGKEINKNIKIVFSKINHAESYLESEVIKNHIGYYFKIYPKPYLNLIFSPPEVNIL